jgi:hypothetical protein
MKKSHINRIFSLSAAILAAALVCALAGCGGPYSGKESEVGEILFPLLEKDAELNGYIWGDRFTTAESVSADDEDSTSAIYYFVSDESPYKSCEELRAAAKEIYSEDLMEIIENYAFENNDTVMSRFCDADADTDADKTDETESGENAGKTLKIDVSSLHPAYKLTAAVRLDSLKVTRSSSTVIECELEYTAGSSDTVRTMTVKLLLEDGVWKLDTQTWAAEIVK